MNIAPRSKWLASAGLLAILGATGAGAATMHRFAISGGTGSGGAATTLQSSASGSALQGEVNSSPNTAIKIPFGVLGEYDAAGSTFGSGVLGIASTGYGVGAESVSATQPSLLAINSAGGPAAEFGGSNGGTGLFATSDGAYAVDASSTAFEFGVAIYGEDDGVAGGFGVYGKSKSSGGSGLFGTSETGMGVFGDSEANTQGYAAFQAFTATPGTEFFEAGDDVGGSYNASTVLSSKSTNTSGGVYTTNRASSDLEMNGDIYLTGAVFTNCDNTVPYQTSKCTTETLARVRGNEGTTYEMYAANHASETVEDEGETTLHAGLAHVALDPAFASVISRREAYLVFTTPKGDTRGLYVTNCTPQGFDVRETSGGRSTLTFDYRIVAHPYGEDAKRMSAVRAKADLASHARRPVTTASIARARMIAHTLADLHGGGTLNSRMPKMPTSFVNWKPNAKR